MRDASPRSIAAHYATCTAFSLSGIAAPFVPEAICLYAGIRYLTGFLYGPRQWRAPARVPLHLGKRGYRDETTRKRGTATWPIGIAGDQQVWLLREDLAQGCAFISDDPDWHAEAIEALVFGACLNQMGALIIQDHTAPPLASRLAALARPFGRDREMAHIDLADPLTSPLRIPTKAIDDALASLGLSDSARNLNAALVPILDLIATSHRRDSLALYQAILDKDALEGLVAGRIDLDHIASTIGASTLPDHVFARLKAISDADREQGRQELKPYARELAATPSLSLTDGFALDAAIAARRLTCLRPSSPFTAAIALALAIEALTVGDPAGATNNVVLVGDPAIAPDIARRFFKAASHAGAIGSIALPTRSDASKKLVEDHCRIRCEYSLKSGASKTHITSSLKDCKFVLDVRPFIADLATGEV